jgi:hypothetical protein
MTGESVAEEPVNEIPLEQSVKEAPLDQQPVNKIPIDGPSINEHHLTSLLIEFRLLTTWATRTVMKSRGKA